MYGVSRADKVASLARRRGFFWPAYEIYGGVGGLYAWGPYGVVLKNKIANLWREVFVYKHDFVEIQSPDIAPYVVFKASGHVDSFKDVMVSCRECNRKYRADTLLKEHGIEIREDLSPSDYEDLIRENNVRCPVCGGELGNATYFTTMFQTIIGPYSENKGFLRPETAQGMFTEFKRVYEAMRKRLPIGIAQVGKGFRNEISPRQGVIRLREFDMMELELFYDPSDDECPYLDDYLDEPINMLHKEMIERGDLSGYETMTVKDALDRKIIDNSWMAYFMILSHIFLEMLGIPRTRQRFREKLAGERAHYARKTFDQEVYLDRWGWVEVSGHADRTDYDLSAHLKNSGVDIYAERRLKEARYVKEYEVRPRVRDIKRDFGDKVGVIMSRLSKSDVNKLLDSFKRDGYILIDDIRLDKKYFDIEVKIKKIESEKFIPHVIEPSFGLDRIAYAVLEYAYNEKGDRIILSLPAYLAPYDAAVYPLLSKDEFIEYARGLYDELVKSGYKILFDYGDSIGKLYARGDEIGIPIAFTVDYKTLEDDTVTVRDRDTWVQYRIDRGRIQEFIEKILGGIGFEEAAASMKLELI